MNKKVCIVSSVILFVFLAIFFILKNNIVQTEEMIEEYVPEQEISEEQLRETTINLYFMNTESGNLSSELRKIDANKLINNPYECLINLLIEGPKNEKFKNIIPEGTKLNSAKLKGEILEIDFTEEFINANIENDDEENIINEILFTVTGLNEVNGIKILINGEENKAFKDNKINFEKVFYIKDN